MLFLRMGANMTKLIKVTYKVLFNLGQKDQEFINKFVSNGAGTYMMVFVPEEHVEQVNQIIGGVK